MRIIGAPRGHAPLEISFEFFPPKSPKASAAMVDAASAFREFKPSFCSVTYGAGGSNQTGTLDAALQVAAAAGSAPAAHLTAVGASRTAVNQVADDYWGKGVRHIVALRGDPQGNAGRYEAHPQGYLNAAELVAGLKEMHDFDISVAAYPEKHPESPSISSDIDNLKRKLDAGAARAITQFFFDPEAYLRFRDRLAARNIWKPVVPGILPIRNIEQVQRFAADCGAVVPKQVVAAFERAADDEDRRRIAVDQAISLCERLLRHGVRDFHFYSLNKADLCLDVCRALNLAAEAESTVAQAAFDIVRD